MRAHTECSILTPWPTERLGPRPAPRPVSLLELTALLARDPAARYSTLAEIVGHAEGLWAAAEAFGRSSSLKTKRRALTRGAKIAERYEAAVSDEHGIFQLRFRTGPYGAHYALTAGVICSLIFRE